MQGGWHIWFPIPLCLPAYMDVYCLLGRHRLGGTGAFKNNSLASPQGSGGQVCRNQDGVSDLCPRLKSIVSWELIYGVAIGVYRRTEYVYLILE